MVSKKTVAVLTGMTASGKSSIALDAARKYGLELINADSIQVYRHLNIGSAKPSAAELKEIPHHLIDILNPTEQYNAGDFVKQVETALADIHGRGKRAMIVGGTGFYIKALLYGLWAAPPIDPAIREKVSKLSSEDAMTQLKASDSVAAEKISMQDRYRLTRYLEIALQTGQKPSELEKETASREPREEFPLLVVDRPEEELLKRISQRTDEMLEAGLIVETQKLLDAFGSARPLGSVGYAQVLDFLKGVPPSGRKIDPGIPGLKSEIVLATRQLARKQRKWFEGEKASQWFHLDTDRAKLEKVLHEVYT